MAISFAPVAYALGSVAVPGTSVAPTNPIPDNCRQIVFRNTSGVNTALFGIGTPGIALTEGINATAIPPLGNFTMSLGTIRDRGVMDEGQLTGSGFVYDSVGGGAIVAVTYTCLLGSEQ